MLKSNIDVFFMTSFLCSLKFLLFHRTEYIPRGVYERKLKLVYGSVFVLFYDYSFKKQCTVPVTLTIDL